MPLESSGFSSTSPETEREIDLEPVGAYHRPTYAQSGLTQFPQPYVPLAGSRNDRGYPYAV